MEESQLSFYYDRCSDDALRPGDRRYVDIDAMEGRPRGTSWADRIARGLVLSRKPACTFVTGLRGTGKSTELLKLAAQLGDPQGPHHLVVLIDGSEVLDIANEIDVPDILTAIVHAAERRVLQDAEGADPDHALRDGFVTRLWTWLTRTEIELGNTKLAPAQQAGLVVEMKTNPTLRQQIRKGLQRHFSKFLTDVREELQLLEERARKAGYQRITIIFDSLEKLKGLSTNWREVLASAERVFGGDSTYLSLPVHVVYTVPPALLNRSAVSIEFMPMVKLFSRTGERNAAGFAAMRDLVRLRLPDEALAEILGEHYEQRAEELITRSGGHPRLLVQMLQWLLLLPEFPAAEEDSLRLFAELRERYQAVITNDDLPWLRKVQRDKSLAIDNLHQHESVDRALTNNVIFRYANADVWYDVHPILPDLSGSPSTEVDDG